MTPVFTSAQIHNIVDLGWSRCPGIRVALEVGTRRIHFDVDYIFVFAAAALVFGIQVVEPRPAASTESKISNGTITGRAIKLGRTDLDTRQIWIRIYPDGSGDSYIRLGPAMDLDKLDVNPPQDTWSVHSIQARGTIAGVFQLEYMGAYGPIPMFLNLNPDDSKKSTISTVRWSPFDAICDRN